MLSHARGGCRLAEAAGGVATGRQLARRPVVAAEPPLPAIEEQHHDDPVDLYPENGRARGARAAPVAADGPGPTLDPGADARATLHACATAAARPRAPPRPPTTARPVERAGYRLGAGDKLRVEVYGESQLSQSLQVRPDGKITLPLVGDTAASGRTAIELRDSVTTSLKEYVTNPVVTVIVVEATAAQVYIIGEVATPGAQVMQGPMTVLQALAQAGGLKEFADRGDIRILRKGNLGTLTIPFNYKDAIRGRIEPVICSPATRSSFPDSADSDRARRLDLKLSRMRNGNEMDRDRLVAAAADDGPRRGAARAVATRPRLTPGWVFTPTMVLGGMWDSNVTVRNQGNPLLQEWVGIVNPRGELDYNGRQLRFNTGYSGALEAYRHVSELNRYEQKARVSTQYRASARLQADGARVLHRHADDRSARARHAAVHRLRRPHVRRVERLDVSTPHAAHAVRGRYRFQHITFDQRRQRGAERAPAGRLRAQPGRQRPALADAALFGRRRLAVPAARSSPAARRTSTCRPRSAR